MAFIYYSNIPDLFENRDWAELYKKMHYERATTPIVLKRGMWKKYWKMVDSFDVKDYNSQQSPNPYLEKLFAIYNDAGDVPNPLADAKGQDLIRRSGVHHTSMSVGDAIMLNGTYYVVSAIGFRELKVK